MRGKIAIGMMTLMLGISNVYAEYAVVCVEQELGTVNCPLNCSSSVGFIRAVSYVDTSNKQILIQCGYNQELPNYAIYIKSPLVVTLSANFKDDPVIPPYPPTKTCAGGLPATSCNWTITDPTVSSTLKTSQAKNTTSKK